MKNARESGRQLIFSAGSRVLLMSAYTDQGFRHDIKVRYKSNNISQLNISIDLP